MIWLPSEDEVRSIHEQLVKMFIDDDDPIEPSGVKSEDGLSSACSRPHTGIGSIDKYNSMDEKVAALFHSLTKNHAFHNGNKRTALVSALTALHRNNKRLINEISDDILYNFVVDVTADRYPTYDSKRSHDDTVNYIAEWFKKNSAPISIKISSMRIHEFEKKCEDAGCVIKKRKGSVKIRNKKNNKSIKLSQSTSEIDGNIVKKYLSKLNIYNSTYGFMIDDFVSGVTDERKEIYRYMRTLRRLAKT